jgi:hypothetical protein
MKHDGHMKQAELREVVGMVSTFETANQGSCICHSYVLGREWQEMERRSDVYRATNGAHTEYR